MFDEVVWQFKRWVQRYRRLLSSLRMRGWAGTLERVRQPRPNEAPDTGPAVSIPVPAPGTRRILIVDAVFPDPERDSGSVRLCTMIRLIGEMGWHVHFHADEGRATPTDLRQLSALGASVCEGGIVRWLRANGGALDAVILSRAPVADQYRGLVRKFAPRALLIFDTVDLHFLRERRGADLLGDPALQRQAQATLRRELELIAACDLSLVVSEEEKRMLADLAPRHRVELLSNIHRVHSSATPFEQRRDLLFIGGFSHPPNLDAMVWFTREVLPLVHRSLPEITLHVVGDLTQAAIAQLSAPRVELHGRVADLSALLDGCRLSVAPLRFGAGVKGKVNTAMSHGLPVVLTPIAAEGMHVSHERDAMIAGDEREFADAIVRAYLDPALWHRLSDGGLQNVATHFSEDVARQTLKNILPH
ncbi:glycosyltransferase family 4 protein [Lysobacter sp. MMG2]|uniref:glycosyltransferase family 4 protein n=1 Tax=Lysobacter sp. MMG2 TaxID=2801338 RepID=UPI001C22A60C|nr:glycosyltransferase family 4 protein [Lysobacter sp. MMG2]